MFNFIKEFSKSYFLFATGGIFPFTIWFIILWIFYGQSLFSFPKYGRFPPFILLILLFMMIIFLFTPYYFWLRCRLLENFGKAKWYSHMISGLFVVPIFCYILTIRIQDTFLAPLIKAAEKSKFSSLWFLLYICILPFIFAEISYRLQRKKILPPPDDSDPEGGTTNR
jgi:hypothetical protein